MAAARVRTISFLWVEAGEGVQEDVCWEELRPYYLTRASSMPEVLRTIRYLICFASCPKTINNALLGSETTTPSFRVVIHMPVFISAF